MPNPALSRQAAEDAILRVENELRAGERAVADGVVGASTSFANRLTAAKARYGLEPDWSLYRPTQYLHRPPGAPVIPFQDHVQESEPEGEPVVVAVIGDAHDAPHLRDKGRFKWMGAFCEEHGVDRVVQIGDWWTMDCFSSHTDRATFEGLAKPTFEQDRESFHASQQAFQDGLAGHRPIKDFCWGNHENRARRYDNFHPDGLSYGDMVDEAFAQWGWRTTPYGQYRFIQGVGFVHVPLNPLGKPYGGVTGGQRAANAAMFDVIHGDSHKSQTSVAEKIGPVRAPTIYNAATALPPGYIEGFANKGGSTWRSGICLATLWGGYVRSWSFTEMILLKRRYGVRLAA